MNEKLVKFVSFLLPTKQMRKSFRTTMRSMYGNPSYTASYAQFAEDRIIAVLFEALFKQSRMDLSYLEIGVCDPVHSNNTYLFYKNGGRGVLVEPNPAYESAIRRHRPEDIYIAAGVTATGEAGNAKYYDFGVELSAWNTFSKQRADQLVAEGHRLEKELTIPTFTVNHILEKHFRKSAPDLISIDVECLDFDLLSSIDFDRFRPKMICVEAGRAHVECGQDTKMTVFMKSKDYTIAVDNFINCIYVDNKALPQGNGNRWHG